MSWSSTRRVEFRRGDFLLSVEASAYVQHWSEEKEEIIGPRCIANALRSLGPAWVPLLLREHATGGLQVRVDFTDVWLGPREEPWQRYTTWDLGLEHALKMTLLGDGRSGPEEQR